MNISKLKVLNGHDGAVYCLAKGFDENLLLSGSADGFVAAWNLDTFTVSDFAVKINSPVFAVCCSKLMPHIYAGAFNGYLFVVDWKNKKELKRIHLSIKGIYAIEENVHTKHLYVGTGSGDLYVLDAFSYEILLHFPFGNGKIRSIKCNANGSLVVLSCFDGYVRVFETKFFNVRFEEKLHSDSANSCFIDDNTILFSVGKDGALVKVDLSAVQIANKKIAHAASIYAVIPTCNGSLATCSRDKSIKIWNAQSFELTAQIDFKSSKSHNHSVNTIFYDKKYQTLISGSEDKSLIVWGII